MVGTREKLWQREPLRITWVWFLGIEESFLGVESLAGIDLRAELPFSYCSGSSNSLCVQYLKVFLHGVQ